MLTAKARVGAVGFTFVCLVLLYAVGASSASAICEKTYERDTGNMKMGCTGFERPGNYIEISAERREVMRGVYCSQTTEANEGNYSTLTACEKGENPNVVKGNYIRTLLPLNCKGEEEEQIEKQARRGKAVSRTGNGLSFGRAETSVGASIIGGIYSFLASTLIEAGIAGQPA